MTKPKEIGSLEELAHHVKSSASLGEESEQILGEIKKNLHDKLRIVKSHAMTDQKALEQFWEEKVIELFIIKVTSLFNHKISVNYYAKNDDVLAYVYRKAPIIHVNRLKFPSTLNKMKKKVDERGEFSKELIAFIAEVTETTLHELTHLREGSDCTVTHDACFRSELANLIATLFTPGERKSIITLFKEAMEEASKADREYDPLNNDVISEKIPDGGDEIMKTPLMSD